MRSTQAVGESRWRSQFLQPGIALLHCGVLAPRSSRAPAIPGLALSKVSRRSRPRSPATAGGAVNFSSLELRFCTAVWLAPRSLRPVLLSSASKVSEVDPCRKRQRLVGRPLSQAREAGAVNFSSLGSRFCTAVCSLLARCFQYFRPRVLRRSPALRTARSRSEVDLSRWRSQFLQRGTALLHCASAPVFRAPGEAQLSRVPTQQVSTQQKSQLSRSQVSRVSTQQSLNSVSLISAMLS